MKGNLTVNAIEASSGQPPKINAASDYTDCALLVADWSVRPEKRVVYEVDVARRIITRRDPRNAAGWTVQMLCDEAHEIISQSNGKLRRCLIAIDVAIGLPVGLLSQWAQHAGEKADYANLADYLRRPPAGADWLGEAPNAQQWSCDRPYIRVPPGNGSLTAFRNRAGDLQINLTRVVDDMTGGKSPLILSGIPGSVGSGSREVLRELWNCLGDEGWQSRVAVWPFDGPIEACTSDSTRVVVGEIYPRSLYGHVLDDAAPADRRRLVVAKTNRKVRELAVQALRQLAWHTQEETHVRLSDEYLALAVANEDDFDAYFSALGLLRLITEGQSLEDSSLGEWDGRPLLDRSAEGGMLGLLSAQAWNDESRFVPPGQHGPPQAGSARTPPNHPAVWTTEAILRAGQAAIVFTGLPAGSRDNRTNVTIQLDNGAPFQLVIGDHFMIWRAHQQTQDRTIDFDTLFEILSGAPGEHHYVTVV